MKKHINGRDNHRRTLVYKFMLKAADSFRRDTDIWSMLFSWGGYNMKFVADRTHRGIYTIYGCNEDEKVCSNRPLCIGYADEIIDYLSDKNNVDDVMEQVE